jgi:hypothetical protein
MFLSERRKRRISFFFFVRRPLNQFPNPLCQPPHTALNFRVKKYKF